MTPFAKYQRAAQSWRTLSRGYEMGLITSDKVEDAKFVMRDLWAAYIASK